MENRNYRHEYKYPLTRGQILIEKARIEAIASKDRNVNEKGYYNIRSLYFDDYENSSFFDNENGVDRREKFRIRIYNGSTERISLESKQKVNGKTRKSACLITLSQCRKLMQGNIPPDIMPDQNILHKLSYLMATRLMKPVVIVDYDRIPYVYRVNDANVRVTFDMQITAVGRTDTFLDKKIYGRGVLSTGNALMEVKFDSFLPDEVHELLQLDHLSASTFSKYYLCRKFMSE